MNTTLTQLMADLDTSIRYQLDGLRGGQLSADDFQQALAQDLLVFHTAAYLAGQDADTLDAAGRAVVVQTMKGQLDYLNPFVDKIAAGDMSDAQIEARALSYAGAVNASWWAGATDGEDLPFQPGDGGTVCLGNCRCEWQADGDAWVWMAEAGACFDCEERAAGSPYGGKQE